ncbi:MAG TPA: ABC transporter permease, partial [Cyclobacteriaceae bacterium]|nr:ABC transporter permease [Cyclobacteriaceae bacterium]
MLKNYFVVAFRNLVRNRTVSLINIGGLAIGLLVCAFIYQYVHFELSYDKFQVNGGRLFRVALENTISGRPSPSATNHPAVGPAMERDFPEVETSTRFVRASFFVNTLTVSYQGRDGQLKTFVEDGMYIADTPFLTMFSYPLLEGDPSTALKQPRSVVISESMKQKYFGDEPAMGKEISLNRELSLVVTGVMKDIPTNTHLSFTSLMSFSTLGDNWGNDQWRWPEFYNYVLLKPGSNPVALQEKLPAFVDKYLGDVKKEYKWKIRMFLQPVGDIHLTSHIGIEQDVNGSRQTVSFLILLGAFILLVAWINYINLSTAQSLERSKEVGLRKVIGASRSQLVIQFFFDALLLNALATIAAVILFATLAPYFEALVGKDLSAGNYISGGLAGALPWLVGMGVLIMGTFVIGAYPALLLSSFNPSLVLKGKFSRSGPGTLLRKLLVSFQYVLSILLMAGTVTIYQQLSYMQNQDLGYNKDQMLVLKSPAVYDSTIASRVRYFKDRLSQVPAVHHTSSSSGIPGYFLTERNGIRRENQQSEDDILAYQQSIDEDFLETFDIPMLAGRALTLADAFTYNKPTQIVINEELSQRMGFASPDEALSTKITFGMGPNLQHAEIVGVIRNYHQVSLKDGYQPIMYFLSTDGDQRYFTVHTGVRDIATTLSAIKEAYMTAFPNNAFEYFFLDEYFNKQYQGDVRIAS